MSREEIAELLLHIFSCRAQEDCCHEVPGYCCWSAGRKQRGAAARTLCKMPVWTKCTIPDAMLMMAIRFGLLHCAVINDVADTGNSVDEYDPGMMRMSN